MKIIFLSIVQFTIILILCKKLLHNFIFLKIAKFVKYIVTKICTPYKMCKLLGKVVKFIMIMLNFEVTLHFPHF